MKNNRMAGERGFIKIIVIVVISLLVLSYFGFNLRELMSRPTTQDNFSYAASTTATVWNKYLKKPVGYAWNQIFLNLIWEPAMDNLRNLDRVDMSPATSTTP